MDTIRKILAVQPAQETITVETELGSVVMSRRNDAELQIKMVALDAKVAKNHAVHWKSVLKLQGFDVEIGEDMVGKILMLHEVIQVEDGEPPLDVIDIVKLAKFHGDVFLKLWGEATMGILNIKIDGGKEGELDQEALVASAMGNSFGDSTPNSLESPSGLSEQPEDLSAAS